MKTTRSFHSQADRYMLDFGECGYDKGFAQVDTQSDAWYFGTWTSPTARRIVSYCEGDLTIEDYVDDAEYVEGLRRMQAWHADNGSWRGIDPGLGEKLRAQFTALGVADLLH